MEKDHLAQRLMAIFVAELAGHVQTFERELLALEKNPSSDERDELFKTLLRTAHSQKGAARSVHVNLIEAVGHRLEDIFTAARDGRVPTDRHFFDLLLPTIDAIGAAARQLGDGHTVDDAPLENAMAQMTALLSGQARIASVARPEVAARPNKELPAAPDGNAGNPAHSGREADSVRVATSKLDLLLRQSSELFVIRYRAEARNEAADRLVEMLAEWKRDWNHVERGCAPFLRPGNAYENDNDPDRIDRHVQKLEQLINRGRDGLSRMERSLHRFAAELGDDRRLIEQAMGPLDTTIRAARMLPFVEACQGLDRAVRDLGAVGNKDVKLVIEGGEIELDRLALDGIKDPLLHLVRNAIDHGIEAPSARQAAGKPTTGQVTVAAALRGTRVEIRVSDDGIGLDRSAIVDRLRKDGEAIPDDERDLIRNIFQPGFSTAVAVTQVSGRGVGLDIVRAQMLRLRGKIDVSFEPGHGTTFVMSMPLTLTSIRAIMIGIGDELFAIETASIDRILRVDLGDLRSVGGRDVLLLPDGTVPIVAVSELPENGCTAGDGTKLPVVVLKAGDRRAALIVDSLQGEREILVRNLGSRLQKVRHVMGGTILPSGRVALILNATELTEWARTHAPSRFFAETQSPAALLKRKRLLIVDDSATIRMLEKSILEAAGYEVMTAADGQEAWQMLLENGADLVVSDIEMPRMDGLSLTETIRKSNRFQNLPIILVTAKESEADRARGMVAGANAYQIKSAFDQRELIVAIERML